MSVSPDPKWDALLDESDAEEAFRELEQRNDRLRDYAPSELALVPDAPSSAAEATTTTQVGHQAQARAVDSSPPALPLAPRDDAPVAPLAEHSARSQNGADTAGSLLHGDPAVEPSKLPQSEWPAFTVPTCDCGHVLGDHKSTWVPAASSPPAGVCLRCDCRAFREVLTHEEAPASLTRPGA